MNKTRNLAIQCIAVFVMFLGVWWWVGKEYAKTHPVNPKESFLEVKK